MGRSIKFQGKQKSLAMKNKMIFVAAGIAMVAGLPSYALAGWIDNVPLRFRPGAHQTAPRNLEAPSAVRTTGSVHVAPGHPAARQPTQPGAHF